MRKVLLIVVICLLAAGQTAAQTDGFLETVMGLTGISEIEDLDEDEYECHRKEMKYPSVIDQILRKNMRKLIRMIQKREGPFQENFIKAYKGMKRKEIVKWAKSFNNPLEFYDAVKNSNLVDLQERYDVEAGLIILSMSKDDSYYFELSKLGISY